MPVFPLILTVLEDCDYILHHKTSIEPSASYLVGTH